MVRVLFCAFLLCLMMCKGNYCAPFTPGNIVVTRVSNPGNPKPLFLYELTKEGLFVQSIPLPCMAEGNFNGVSMDGNLQLNEIGSLLTVGCYPNASSAANLYTVLTIDSLAQITTTTVVQLANKKMYSATVQSNTLYLGYQNMTVLTAPVGSNNQQSANILPATTSTDYVYDIQIYKSKVYYLYRGLNSNNIILVSSNQYPPAVTLTTLLTRSDTTTINAKFHIFNDTLMYMTQSYIYTPYIRRFVKTGSTWAQTGYRILDNTLGYSHGIVARLENGQVTIYYTTIQGVFKMVDDHPSLITSNLPFKIFFFGTQEVLIDVTATPTSCNTGVKDGLETDVDCGGSACAKCADNKLCSVNADCQNNNCNPGTGRCGTCSDSLKNQDETDVDCGGITCSKCVNGKMCVSNSDCLSGVCNSGTKLCVAQSCKDKIQNQNETDVDCGGVCNTVTKCFAGKKCLVNQDCITFYCNPLKICSNPACNDTFLNLDETDVDCGGSTCLQCNDTLSCLIDSDCVSNYCNPLQKCSTPSCDDGFKNQDENGIDCGGICGNPCNDGTPCSTNEECSSGFCRPSDHTCAQPTCSDTYQNQDETDVDCGHSCGATCIDGQKCVSLDDCVSNYCNPNNNCSTPSCSDTWLNQNETDTDCGGPCGATCVDGLQCAVNGDCVSDYCNPAGFCSTPTCPDTWLNQDETDVDCGGSCEIKCNDGKKCLNNGDCVNDYCAEGLCVMPTCDDNVMNGNETDVDCGGSCKSCGECLSDSDCLSGICKDSKCVPRIVSVSIGHVTISAVHALYLSVICSAWLVF